MKFLVLVLVAVSACFSGISGQDPTNVCPPENELSPCTCTQTCSDCVAVIKCANLRNLDELNTVLTNTRDYPFRTFSIINSSLLYVPAATVASKQYVYLNIFNCSMVSLFEEAPAESSVLKELNVKNVTFQRGLEWELFSPLKSLTSLQIYNTDIKKIGDSFGENMSKTLRLLHLEGTKTRQLGSQAFAPLKDLGSVVIVDSEISTVERSMFPRPLLASLWNLDENKIESLPDDFLTDIPNLTGFSVRNNQLRTFAESVFGNLPSNVRAIFVEDNPIVCDCNLRWLTKKQKMAYIEGTCSEPSNMKGKNLRDLKEADFAYC